jgi:hypothetical protein
MRETGGMLKRPCLELGQKDLSYEAREDRSMNHLKSFSAAS